MNLVSRIKLASGDTIAMYFVNSSNIYAVGYVKSKEELYIQFLDGSVYKYENVEPDIWRMLQIVESKGSFLHFYVKINDDTYPYTDVTGEVQIEYVGTTINPGTPHEKYMVY